MLTSTLIHPPLLRALAAAGHGSTVLVADGNYPVATATAATAAVVHLNLRPGVLDVVEVTRTLLGAVPVEAAHVMTPGAPPDPPIFAELTQLLRPSGVALQPLDRAAFYAAARSQDLAVVVATGDQRLFANLLLTIGVVPPGTPP